jgi:hypothetical protein
LFLPETKPLFPVHLEPSNEKHQSTRTSKEHEEEFKIQNGGDYKLGKGRKEPQVRKMKWLISIHFQLGESEFLIGIT